MDTNYAHDDSQAVHESAGETFREIIRVVARALARHWPRNGREFACRMDWQIPSSNLRCVLRNVSRIARAVARDGQRSNRWMIQPPLRSGHFASHQSPTEHHGTIHESTRKTTRENPIGELAGHLAGDPTACARCRRFCVLAKTRTVL